MFRSAYTWRTPPEISLPIVTPPWPSRISQSRTMMFSLGTLMRRPSALRPDLIAMQSSPVSKRQRSISTSRHDSGSQPSLFGPWLSIVTSRTVTFVQSTGLISHIGEFRIVTPSMSTLRQRYGWMNCGRRNDSTPNRRALTGTPSSAISNSRARASRWLPSPCFQP